MVIIIIYGSPLHFVRHIMDRNVNGTDGMATGSIYLGRLRIDDQRRDYLVNLLSNNHVGSSVDSEECIDIRNDVVLFGPSNISITGQINDRIANKFSNI